MKYVALLCFQVAVALVRKLGTRFGRPMNVEAAYFADSLYNAWEMDYKQCKNGLLLVISVVDREVWTNCRCPECVIQAKCIGVQYHPSARGYYCSPKSILKNA